MARGWQILGSIVLLVVVLQVRAESDNDIQSSEYSSLRDTQGGLRIQRSAGEGKGGKRKNKPKSKRKGKAKKNKKSSKKRVKNSKKSGRRVKNWKNKSKSVKKRKTKTNKKKTNKNKKKKKGKGKSERKVKQNRNSSDKNVKKVRKSLKGKSKNKKKNRNKIKKIKESKKGRNAKKKKSRKPKSRKQQGTRQDSTTGCVTTSTQVSDLCLQDAVTSLLYEKNQVTNYLKQSARLKSHGKISTNKLAKKGEFASAARHMLWAIGGNLSDPKCGEEVTASGRQSRGLVVSVENYNKLNNCSATIHAACDIELNNDTSYNTSDHSENMDTCNDLKKDFIKVSKECISSKDQANATLQCECWHKAAVDVKAIKTNKCETKSQQKLVTKHKNQCVKAFGVCKKLEDEAIELIHVCMHDHSADFINLTAKGLQESAQDAKNSEIEESGKSIADAGALLFKLS